MRLTFFTQWILFSYPFFFLFFLQVTQISKKATSSGSPSTCKSKIEHVERTNNHAATRRRKRNKNILKLTLVSHAVCGFRVSEARLTSFQSSMCCRKAKKYFWWQFDRITDYLWRQKRQQRDKRQSFDIRNLQLPWQQHFIPHLEIYILLQLHNPSLI